MKALSAYKIKPYTNIPHVYELLCDRTRVTLFGISPDLSSKLKSKQNLNHFLRVNQVYKVICLDKDRLSNRNNSIGFFDFFRGLEKSNIITHYLNLNIQVIQEYDGVYFGLSDLFEVQRLPVESTLFTKEMRRDLYKYLAKGIPLTEAVQKLNLSSASKAYIYEKLQENITLSGSNDYDNFTGTKFLPDLNYLLALVKLLDTSLGKVWIHCASGAGRTAMCIFLYVMLKTKQNAKTCLLHFFNDSGYRNSELHDYLAFMDSLLSLQHSSLF